VTGQHQQHTIEKSVNAPYRQLGLAVRIGKQDRRTAANSAAYL
jgi:hypothetical protein